MILVFGTVCLDKIRRVQALPAPGGYSEVLEESVHLGGEAANTAASLHEWGAKYQLIGNAIGKGGHGDKLVKLLNEKGLHFTAERRSSSVRTPICDIYVTPDGDRTMFGIGFAEIDGNDDEIGTKWPRCDWITGDGNMPKASAMLFKDAPNLGGRVYAMDLADRDLPLDKTSVWQSSTDLFGVRGNASRNVEWLSDFIKQRGCFAVLSDGPNGFVAGSPTHKPRSYPPYPAPKVLDTTGAGDAFRAGMLFGLDSGWPIAETLRFAAAVGSLQVGELGGADTPPTFKAILAHMGDHPEIGRSYE